MITYKISSHFIASKELYNLFSGGEWAEICHFSLEPKINCRGQLFLSTYNNFIFSNYEKFANKPKVMICEIRSKQWNSDLNSTNINIIKRNLYLFVCPSLPRPYLLTDFETKGTYRLPMT